MEMMRRLAHERGRAVVVVTHDSRVMEFGDRIVRIEDGMIAKTRHELEVPAGMLLQNSQSSAVAVA